jgi:hypothetical protein
MTQDEMHGREPIPGTPIEDTGDDMPDEQAAAETRTCWDCGSEFTPTFGHQRECTRCYVAGKL